MKRVHRRLHLAMWIVVALLAAAGAALAPIARPDPLNDETADWFEAAP